MTEPTNKIVEQIEVLRIIHGDQLHPPTCDCKYCSALSFFIRVGEKLSEEKLAFILYKSATDYNISEKEYEGDWARVPYGRKEKWLRKAQALLTELTKEDTQNDQAEE